MFFTRLPVIIFKLIRHQWLGAILLIYNFPNMNYGYSRLHLGLFYEKDKMNDCFQNSEDPKLKIDRLSYISFAKGGLTN